MLARCGLVHHIQSTWSKIRIRVDVQEKVGSEDRNEMRDQEQDRRALEV